MKTSELIRALQGSLDRDGDLEVRVPSQWQTARKAQPVRNFHINGDHSGSYVILIPHETPEKGETERRDLERYINAHSDNCGEGRR